MQPPRLGTVAVLLPYYNEARYIAATLRSLLEQSRPPDQIILVDNASTDGSEAVAREVVAACGYPHATWLREERPGKVNALEAGCRHIACEFTALCDADIWYPPHYLALAMSLFAAGPPRLVAVMAQTVESPPQDSPETRARLARNVFWSKVLTSKSFTGGAGQIFRAKALMDAGGFSTDRWNYVLLDHEIVNRVRKRGTMLYHKDLWVLHTDRRKDRSGVRWNLWDRMLYRYTPAFLGDWYFYRYLAPRLRKRKMTQQNLRAQPWSGSASGQN
jgi:glycosyltransferase involved in cell wall biosynthesis